MRLLHHLLPLLCAVPLAAQSLSSPPVQRHLLAAEAAQAKQDCHGAAREYAAAVLLVPADAQLRTNQGIALYCDNQLAAAVSVLHKALQLNRELAPPHLFLGLAAYRGDNPAEAVGELRHFLAAKPNDRTAQLWLGYALVAQHKQTEAAGYFEKVAKADPSNVDAEYALGQTWLEIGREKARELQVLAPGSPLLLRLAGEQYRLLGDTQRATEAFDRAGTHPDSSDAAITRQSELFHGAEDAEQRARQAFQSVVREAPDSFRSHQIAADTFLLMQDQERAVAQYRLVATLNPTLPGIHEAIGNCLMQQAHFADAIAELHKEQDLQPQSARVAMELGRAQLAMGDSSGATESLQNALRRRDPPAETFLLLGRAAMRTGHAKDAIAPLQHYVTLVPDAGAAFYLLSRAYRQTGDRDASASALATSQQLGQAAELRQLTEVVTQDPGGISAHSGEAEAEDGSSSALPHP